MLMQPFVARIHETATRRPVSLVVGVLVIAQVGLLIYRSAHVSLPWFVTLAPVCLALLVVLSRPGLLSWDDYFTEAPDAPMKTTAGEWLLIIAQIIIGGLKSSDVIEWSWPVVLIPTWILIAPIACLVVHLVLRFFVGCYKAIFSFLACS